MNTKVRALVRLTPFLEFNFSKIDEYWKARAQCFFWSLDVFGDKGELIRRVEEMLFDNYLYKKNPEDALRELADTEIEALLRNIKRAPKEKDAYSVSELERQLKEGKK